MQPGIEEDGALAQFESLPDWIKRTLREIVLFELMRSYFRHPFNRYAWVVL
jgi:hypothetical protein